MLISPAFLFLHRPPAKRRHEKNFTNLQVLRLLDAMCLANGLTDAFALEARPSSATYNPISAAAWNAAKGAAKANKGMSVEAMAEMSDAARSEAEAKMLGASAMNITPGAYMCASFHVCPELSLWIPPPPPCVAHLPSGGPLDDCCCVPAWYIHPGSHVSAARLRAFLGTRLYPLSLRISSGVVPCRRREKGETY